MKKLVLQAATIFFINVFIFSLFIRTNNLTSISAQEIQKSYSSIEVARPKVEYKAEGLVDPFQPIRPPKEEEKKVEAKKIVVEVPKPVERLLPHLKVQGVIWGGSFPQAIINNKIVKIGDTIEEVIIKNIEKGQITLIFEERQFTIPTPSTEVTASKRPQGGQDEKNF
jgi:hypothetical protein